jgi:hypothetical protein
MQTARRSSFAVPVVMTQRDMTRLAGSQLSMSTVARPGCVDRSPMGLDRRIEPGLATQHEVACLRSDYEVTGAVDPAKCATVPGPRRGVGDVGGAGGAGRRDGTAGLTRELRACTAPPAQAWAAP